MQGPRQGPLVTSKDTARGIMLYSEITRVSLDQRYYLRLSTLSAKLPLPLIPNMHFVLFTWLGWTKAEATTQLVQRRKTENRIFSPC